MKKNDDDEELPLNDKNGKDKLVDREDLKLLLDSSYPILHQFRELCPGTFKHSQSVHLWIENIALSLGLDTVLMKVAALYHDVGKMFNPKYFSENQLENENPHDTLDPFTSYNIITRHVSDSVMILLNDINFPRNVIRIISQHHGTTVLKYFYNNTDRVDKDVFRYKSTKPSCVESAVLAICDQVDATSRSLIQANKFDPSLVIESTISGLIDDGQLDDVMMRLGHLKKIKESISKDLEGTYQKRVDYNKGTTNI